MRHHRKALAAADIAWIGPEAVRAAMGQPVGALWRRVGLAAAQDWRVRRRLVALIGPGRAVASDENCLGRLGDMMAAGRLYPHARAGVARWAAAMAKGGGREEARVYLAIRDYAAFFAACHAQSLRGGAPAPLSGGARAALAALPRRWPDVVADIRRALPGARLTLWRFEDHGALAPRLLALMSGMEGLTPVNRRPMATPGAAAMAAIFAAAAARPDRRLPKEAFDELAAAHAGAPPYRPFETAEAAAMAAAYEADLATLRADPGLTFLSP